MGFPDGWLNLFAAAMPSFARAERLDWWQRKGAALVDIPAERYAECSCVNDDLVWADLRPGDTILGIIVEQGGTNRCGW